MTQQTKPVESPTGDKKNTVTDSITEMSLLLTIVQKMGRTLSNETHNEAYGAVNDLNQLLHQAHLLLEKIRTVSIKNN